MASNADLVIETETCNNCQNFKPRGVGAYSNLGTCLQDGMKVEKSWFCGFWKKKKPQGNP